MADDVAELIVLDDTASLQRPHEDQQAEYVEAQSAAGLIRAVVVPSGIAYRRCPRARVRTPQPRSAPVPARPADARLGHLRLLEPSRSLVGHVPCGHPLHYPPRLGRARIDRRLAGRLSEDLMLCVERGIRRDCFLIRHRYRPAPSMRTMSSTNSLIHSSAAGTGTRTATPSATVVTAA